MGVAYISRRRLNLGRTTKSVALATVNATTIIQHLVRVTGFYSVDAMVKNITGSAVTITLALNYTDPDMGASTFDWYTGGTVPALTVATQPTQYIEAKAGTLITVVATAGTANALKIGARIGRE